ncbi:MAG: hypothetical protein SFW35_09125 [Chitinophagales bacterium]|nr:hypothetical protein [Chitinophagales bacterium]
MFHTHFTSAELMRQIVLVLPFFLGSVTIIYALCKFASPHSSNAKYWFAGLTLLTVVLIFVRLLALPHLVGLMGHGGLMMSAIIGCMVVGCFASHYYLRREHL